MLAALLVLCGTSSALADDVLAGTRARHPLTGLIGVPAPAARGVADHQLTLSLEVGNAFMGGNEGGERLLLDGETTDLSVHWRQRVGDCWVADVGVPFIGHSGGRFDSPIERWHDAFGLPNAGREDAPEDELWFEYEDANGRRSALSSGTAGLGDVSLSMQRSLRCRTHALDGRPRPGNREPILRFGAKLPTGDRARWTGSGGLDLWLDVQSPVLEFRRRGRLAASFGLIAPGAHDGVGELRPLAAFGAVGVRALASTKIALIAQLDWNTPLYDSELTELGQGAAQLGVGFAWTPSTVTSLEFTILEDVLVDTSTDIVARIAFRREALAPPTASVPGGAVRR